tara:strand:- start:30129 stop:30749 length:621 start_codon:yes stop_codon:yes gene_type:complete
MALKHIGRITDTKKKCAVVYRVVPGEPTNSVIVMTESLAAEEHDSLMTLIESQAGQEAYELGEAMARATLPDGRIMLSAFHATGKMNKVDSARVEMVPNSSTTVNLSELNRNIADQKGVSVADLALKGPDGNTVPDQTAPKVDATAMYSENEVATDDGVLTDEQLAASYRSQADRLFKEAKALREQAEELVPTKRKKATADATEEG